MEHQVSLKQRRRTIQGVTILSLLAFILTLSAAIYLQSRGSSYTENAIFLSTVSAGFLVFVLGVNAWSKFVKGSDSVLEETERPRRATVIFHAGGLLLGYYLASLIANIGLFTLPPNTGWIENTGRILFFIVQTTFPGIVLMLALITFSMLFLRGLYQKVVNGILPTTIFSVLLFALGFALSQIDAVGLTDNILAIVAGSNTIHSYPLLQYLGLYLFGLYWGRRLSETNQSLIKPALYAIISLLGLYGLLAVINSHTPHPLIDPVRVFSPSLSVLILILGISFLSYLIVKSIFRLLTIDWLHELIRRINQYDHDLIIFSIIVTGILIRLDLFQESVNPFLAIVIIFLLTLITSIVLAWIRLLLVHQVRNQLVTGFGFKWKLNDKLILTVLWLVFGLTAVLFVVQNYGSVLGIDTSTSIFSKLEITKEGEIAWWDHNYDYFRPILIENGDETKEIPRNTWYSLEFDHSQLVEDKKSRKDGGDVRIIYSDGSDEGFTEVPFKLTGINSTALLTFKLQETIPANAETSRYFLYYGNTDSSSFPKSSEEPLEVQTTSISLLEEQKHLLSGQTDKTWYLRSNIESTEDEPGIVMYSIQLDESLPDDAQVSYSILGTDLGGVMQNATDKYEATVDVTGLEPGYYQVQATAITIDGQIRVHRSGISNIAVSDPLYVLWTQDWEGWDIPQGWLQGLDDLSAKYDIPMTHFFNPRIYLLSQTSAQLQTDWVKKRISENSDEIQLHLHMWTDMVAAAGVEPREEPVASWVKTGNGYNVPTYAYTIEELEKILEWSKNQFTKNGLPVPEFFRAGLWMAGENVLEALENTGFLGDSSGRTEFNMGETSVPWSLPEDAQPYQPNLYDMNRSLEPTFNLWEYPNNGADSYWFSADQLIDRFKKNYPEVGKPFEGIESIIYLSHPNFYLVDQPKLEILFDYMDDFNFSKDRGPVVYTTLKKLHSVYAGTGN